MPELTDSEYEKYSDVAFEIWVNQLTDKNAPLDYVILDYIVSQLHEYNKGRI